MERLKSVSAHCRPCCFPALLQAAEVCSLVRNGPGESLICQPNVLPIGTSQTKPGPRGESQSREGSGCWGLLGAGGSAASRTGRALPRATGAPRGSSGQC